MINNVVPSAVYIVSFIYRAWDSTYVLQAPTSFLYPSSSATTTRCHKTYCSARFWKTSLNISRSLNLQLSASWSHTRRSTTSSIPSVNLGASSACALPLEINVPSAMKCVKCAYSYYVRISPKVYTSRCYQVSLSPHSLNPILYRSA